MNRLTITTTPEFPQKTRVLVLAGGGNRTAAKWATGIMVTVRLDLSNAQNASQCNQRLAGGDPEAVLDVIRHATVQPKQKRAI